jgi:hypothetical protein
MALNTACERLTHAKERIKTVGWRQRVLRDRVNTDSEAGDYDYFESFNGPGCLIGSLVDDEEFARYRRGKLLSLYYGVASLPGLEEAYTALGFAHGHAAYGWNDEVGRTVDEVLTRIDEGKAKVCPKEENELGTGPTV